MTEPIDELYFKWLCAKVARPGLINYYQLLRILYMTEFVWIVAGDRNRAADGIELREFFLRETGFENDEEWFQLPCSVLEALIAFANRASFQTDMPVRKWFWDFLATLGLDEFRQISDQDLPKIEEILNTFIWRTYGYDGIGGLFPMRTPRRDQSQTEIWYQFCDWVSEQGMF